MHVKKRSNCMMGSRRRRGLVFSLTCLASLSVMVSTPAIAQDLPPAVFEDPAGGTQLDLQDDSATNLAELCPEDFVYEFYGIAYTAQEIFVSSNGLITFGQEDMDFQESLEAMAIGMPRIAPLWDDLNPAEAGGVFAECLLEKLAVTWLEVPEADIGGASTFQVTLFPSAVVEAESTEPPDEEEAVIRICYGKLTTHDGVVGISPGIDGLEADLNRGRPPQAMVAEEFDSKIKEISVGDTVFPVPDIVDLEGSCLFFTAPAEGMPSFETDFRPA